MSVYRTRTSFLRKYLVYHHLFNLIVAVVIDLTFDFTFCKFLSFSDA